MADCCSKYCSRWTLPSLLWSVVSVVSAILCSVGVYFSNWLQHETNAGLYNSISSFRLCVNQSSQISISCESYFTFNDISSTEWQAVTLIMGAGACFLVFTALLSLFVICGYNFFTKCSTCVLATLQSVGVLLFVVTVFLFPAGMNNKMVQHPDLCGANAGSFELGECTIGWSYIVVIIGTTLGMVAVLMSWMPVMWNKKKPDSHAI